MGSLTFVEVLSESTFSYDRTHPTTLQMKGRRVEASKGQHARLPAIAPRDHREPMETSSSSSRSGSSTLPLDARKNRLPPRSKCGCWTCRNRKVKCDEQRPECGQCLRLGHTCDYNPRLAFRDDTPRIVERMRDTFSVGRSVFDEHPYDNNQLPTSSSEDLLPPFAALTTDEEREKKAESQTPGTYHVVANPSSFADLPEYRDDSRATSGSRRDSYFNLDYAAYENPGSGSGLSNDDLPDPNIVILKNFDDSTRKGQALFSSERKNTISPSPSQNSLPHTPFHIPNPLTILSSNPNLTMGVPERSERDAQLLRHYRTTVAPLTIGGPNVHGEDVFEIQARTYPPLHHAMLALAALSMAYKNRVQTADALEHYQQVIPALQNVLRNPQDSFSDGALFTHFLLLLYEILAADHRESNMWQHHCNQLMKILTLRRQSYGTEPYEIIIFRIFAIDIYALMSMNGAGKIAVDIMEQNMLPSAKNCLPFPTSDQPGGIDDLVAITKLNQEVFLLALQIGQLARTLRTELSRVKLEASPQGLQGIADPMERHAQVQGLQRRIQQFQTAWSGQYPNYLTELVSPELVLPNEFSGAIHAYTLFRACVIYAHCSMFAGQKANMSTGSESEVRKCVKEIIRAAQLIVLHERSELRAIVFPLFIAGFATSDLDEKGIIINLVRVFEQSSSGRSTASVRRLLENVCEQQRNAVLQIGTGDSVCWVEEMERSGQGLIICGL